MKEVAIGNPANSSAPLSALAARAQLLARSFLFRGLEPSLLERVARLCQPRRLSVGETLFWEDEPADALYGVAKGLIRIWVHGPDGRELTLNLMEGGDFFGEIALLDGLPRTASASALADTEMLSVPRAAFQELMRQEPRLALHIIELLCERLRHNTDRIRDAAFLDLGTRLAKTLEALAMGHGEDGPDGIVITAKLNQSELAQLLGVTREAVNKQLKQFTKDGLITTKGGRIIVRNSEGLTARGKAPEESA
ncbi:Crp/Fnr family transcriptional regulator [Dongia sp.]|uniref:Crp/Fnr family transcriptional regulator n=1 Tax=Dongia sp. TaxID=1977262 RepID=UPI0035B1792B